VALDGIQMLGGYGYTGTSEIQRDIIAKPLL
jgi:alkylation response protein AidB-like acyl-CoA dehydrogenase